MEASNVASIPELLTSLRVVRDSARALSRCTTLAFNSERALILAAAAHDAHVRELEAAGFSLVSALATAASVASRGGARAAVAALSALDNGATVSALTGYPPDAGVDADATSSFGTGVGAAAMAAARARVRDAAGDATVSLGIGRVLAALALSARADDVASVFNELSAAGAVKAEAGPVAPPSQHAAPTLAAPAPTAEAVTKVAEVLSPSVARPSPRVRAGAASSRNYTIHVGGSAPAAPAALLVSTSPESTFPAPLLLSAPQSPTSPPSSPQPSLTPMPPAQPPVPSTPIELAQRAAADVCATAALAIAALEPAADVTAPLPPPLSCVPRFAAALAAAHASQEKGLGALGSDVEARNARARETAAAASDRGTLALERGQGAARGAASAVRGALARPVSVDVSSLHAVADAALLAQLSADLARVDKLLHR